MLVVQISTGAGLECGVCWWQYENLTIICNLQGIFGCGVCLCCGCPARGEGKERGSSFDGGRVLGTILALLQVIF